TISGTTVNFDTNFRVSSQSFPAVFGQDPVINSTYMGDYDQAAADSNFFYDVWGDNRSSDAFHANQPDVRLAEIPIAGLPPPAGPAVSSSSPSGTVTPPVSTIDFHFDSTMNTSSFSFSDVDSFIGPNGSNLIGALSGFSWLDNSTLRVTFTSQST